MNKNSTRYYSKRQEKSVAKAVGGKVQPNSGATRFEKGDVKTDLFCIECKTAVTEKKSFSIKLEWIETLKEEAFGLRKPFWAIVFNFGGLRKQENFYIINEQLFNRLQDYLAEEDI